MKRFLLALLAALLPLTATAQVYPVVSDAPLWGLPWVQGSSSNPFVNISFTGQALGPDSCTAYSFTSAPTTGYGYNGTLLCLSVAGSNIFTVSASNAVSTVPFTGPASATVPIYAVTGDTDTGFGASAADTAAIFAGGVTPVLTATATAVEIANAATLPATGTASATVFNFGTPGTGLYGDTEFVNVSTVGTNAFRFDGSANTAFIIGSGFSLAFGLTVASPDWTLGRDSASVAAMGNGDILQTAGGGGFSAGTASSFIRASGAAAFFQLANAFAINTAPTVSNGCTAEAMTWNNGTVAFEADMGNTCAGVSTVVFTLPAITNKYGCKATNLTSPATVYLDPTAWAATTVTFTNFSRTTGLAVDFADGDDVLVTCLGG